MTSFVIPKGFRTLPEIVNAIGSRRFGRDWIGDRIAEFDRTAAQARAVKDPDAEHAALNNSHMAKAQWREIFDGLQVEFLGTPPRHRDAVPVLVENESGFRWLPPEVWAVSNASTRAAFEDGWIEVGLDDWDERVKGIPLIDPAGFKMLEERIFGPLAGVAGQERKDLQYPACELALSRANPATDGVSIPTTELPTETLDTAPVIDRRENLVEWIFAQHPQDGRAPAEKNDLHERALRSGAFPGLTGVEFTAAYQRVYETANHRRPRGGWPLREEFAGRLKSQK